MTCHGTYVHLHYTSISRTSYNFNSPREKPVVSRPKNATLKGFLTYMGTATQSGNCSRLNWGTKSPRTSTFSSFAQPVNITASAVCGIVVLTANRAPLHSLVTSQFHDISNVLTHRIIRNVYIRKCFHEPQTKQRRNTWRTLRTFKTQNTVMQIYLQKKNKYCRLFLQHRNCK